MHLNQQGTLYYNETGLHFLFQELVKRGAHDKYCIYRVAAFSMFATPRQKWNPLDSGFIVFCVRLFVVLYFCGLICFKYPRIVQRNLRCLFLFRELVGKRGAQDSSAFVLL